MIIWMIGIISICLGTLEQFLVNESRIMAGIIFEVGIILFLSMKVKNTKLAKWQMISIFGITSIHIIGLISDRWIVYSGLGILTTVLGIIFIVWSFIKIKSKNHLILIFQIVISVISVVIAISIMTITFFPKDSFAVFKNIIHAYGNETTAEVYEDTLENSAHLVANIQYDTVYPNGFLDVYYTDVPKSDNPPTLLFIHGGGYTNGDKSSGDPNAGDVDYRDSLAYRALSEGYNVVQFNYCLMTEHVFPDAIIQLNSGLKYLKNHADNLNLNMDELFLSGGSAGGNLAGVMANLQTIQNMQKKWVLHLH